MHALRLLAAVAVTAGLSAPVSAAFIVPDSATAPFQDWTRGDADSLYAHWDLFTVPNGAPGNTPDVGDYPAAGSPLGDDARLTQNTTGAFLTGGGNIYSFSVATDFTLTAPNYSHGAGWNTRVVLQINALGTELDLNSVELTYHDGSSNVTLDPTQHIELARTALGGFGGAEVDHLFVFDIAGYNPASLAVDFAAVEHSMSLNQVALDTYTSLVPEPASMALLLLGVVTSARRRA